MQLRSTLLTLYFIKILESIFTKIKRNSFQKSSAAPLCENYAKHLEGGLNSFFLKKKKKTFWLISNAALNF